MELFWKAALQGIVQGLTEFLPVSSTGHLILVGNFLNMGNGGFVKMFNVVIQLASILAVVIYFHRKLIPAEMFRDRAVRKAALDIWFKTAAGVLPILIIGFLAARWVEAIQEQPLVVAGALFVGGVLLLRIEDWCKSAHPIGSMAELPYKTAVLIGLIQCLAMVPGTSRSAATIIGALALGAARPLAAEFSFFLAVPTMAAASGYSLLKHGGAMTGEQWIALAVGFGMSFLVSLGVIAWLMNFIRTRTFKVFGWYRIILAAAVVIWMWVK